MGKQHMLDDAQPQPQVENHRRYQSDQEGAQRPVGRSSNGIYPINHSGWTHLIDLNLVAANNQLKQLYSAIRSQPRAAWILGLASQLTALHRLKVPQPLP